MVVSASSSDMSQTKKATQPKPSPDSSSDDFISSVCSYFSISFSPRMSCFYLAMASPAVGRYTYILRVFATMYTRECFMYRRIPCRRPVSLLRVFTDADIVIPEEWRVLKQFLENIINYMHSKEINLPPKVDLALGLTWYENGPPTCEYYFADHIYHSIFWLDGFDASMMRDVKWWYTSESSHLKHALEAQYWSVLTVPHHFVSCGVS